MFHVELRRFPHQARAFNLSEDELRERFVARWVRGVPIALQDRSWSSDGKTRLTVYEAPELPAEDRGLGRGWSTVTREGTDVTARVLGELSPLSDLKRQLLEAVPLSLGDVLALVGDSGRVSERVAIAEQAIWELLHAGRLEVEHDGLQVSPEEWEALLLRWESWTSPGVNLRS